MAAVTRSIGCEQIAKGKAHHRVCFCASVFMHWPFACFLAALLFFHCSEAALAYAFNPNDAGRQSVQRVSLRSSRRASRRAYPVAETRV